MLQCFTRMGRNALLPRQWQVRRGRQLAAEKTKCVASGQTWRRYVKDELGLSRERADELIRIGLGSLSVEASRAAKKDSQRASRARRTRSFAKVILLSLASRTTKACSGLHTRIGRAQVSHDDLVEMREAVCQAIASWEALQSALDALEPAKQPTRDLTLPGPQH